MFSGPRESGRRARDKGKLKNGLNLELEYGIQPEKQGGAILEKDAEPLRKGAPGQEGSRVYPASLGQVLYTHFTLATRPRTRTRCSSPNARKRGRARQARAKHPALRALYTAVG